MDSHRCDQASQEHHSSRQPYVPLIAELRNLPPVHALYDLFDELQRMRTENLSIEDSVSDHEVKQQQLG